MDEHALREMITDVKAGRMSRRSFVRTMVGLGLTAPHGRPAAGRGGSRPAQPQGAGLHADAPRRRRAAEDALVAGAHPAQSALRHRHQGPGRLADLLRAPGRLRSRRQLVPVLAAEIPSVDNGGLGRDGTLGDLEPQEGRHLARRQALHRRRRGLQLGVRRRSRHRRGHDRLLSRDRPRREARRPHRQGHLQAAAARSGPRPSAASTAADHPQAPLRAFQGRQVAARRRPT